MIEFLSDEPLSIFGIMVQNIDFLLLHHMNALGFLTLGSRPELIASNRPPTRCLKQPSAAWERQELPVCKTNILFFIQFVF